MGPTATRLLCTALLALTPLWSSGCNPSGARFAGGVLSITGTEGADSFVVSAAADGSIVVNGGAVPIQGGVPTVSNTVRITIDGRGGDDQLVVNQFGAPLPDATLYGGPGADVLIGGSGNDTFVGGEGNDQAIMGAGDDTFHWLPGHGQDTVDGQAGADKLLFQGSDESENIDIAAVSNRVRFFRNIDSVTTDLGGVETLEFLALGGSDAIVVGELTGTDVTRVGLDLKGSSGSGDGQADRISVNATQGDDLFGAEGENGVIRVFGLSASVEILGAEQAGDLLTLNALAGADVVDATAPGTEGIQLVLNGGLGIDVLLGGEGAEVFSGGDGDDTVLMGGGDDTLVWNPGDDLDTVEGQEGFDTLRFNGSNVSESIDISSSGGRVRFFRNVATVTLDLDDVEAIDFAAQGGSDFILVDDLSGTDVLEVNLALAAVSGTGDAQPDTVFVQGTGGNDSVIVQEDADLVSVLGLPAQVTIKTPEIALDSLHVYPVAGDDVVDASGLSASSIQFVADGGADHDVLIGGDGADVLAGGDGDDVLLGGPGLDVLDGGPGDNIVIQ